MKQYQTAPTVQAQYNRNKLTSLADGTALVDPTPLITAKLLPEAHEDLAKEFGQIDVTFRHLTQQTAISAINAQSTTEGSVFDKQVKARESAQMATNGLAATSKKAFGLAVNVAMRINSIKKDFVNQFSPEQLAEARSCMRNLAESESGDEGAVIQRFRDSELFAAAAMQASCPMLCGVTSPKAQEAFKGTLNLIVPHVKQLQAYQDSLTAYGEKAEAQQVEVASFYYDQQLANQADEAKRQATERRKAAAAKPIQAYI